MCIHDHLRGFRLAAEHAMGTLSDHGIATDGDEGILHEVAKTSLTGKSAGAVKAFLAEICVDAVHSVGLIEEEERYVDLDDIKVEKRQGGSIKDSTLVDGIILDKERVHPGMRVVQELGSLSSTPPSRSRRPKWMLRSRSPIRISSPPSSQRRRGTSVDSSTPSSPLVPMWSSVRRASMISLSITCPRRGCSLCVEHANPTWRR